MDEAFFDGPAHGVEVKGFGFAFTVFDAEDFEGFGLGGGGEGEEAEVELRAARKHGFADLVFGVVVHFIFGRVLFDSLFEVNDGEDFFPSFGGFAALGAVGFVHDDGVVALGHFADFAEDEGEFLQGGDGNVDALREMVQPPALISSVSGG